MPVGVFGEAEPYLAAADPGDGLRRFLERAPLAVIAENAAWMSATA